MISRAGRHPMLPIRDSVVTRYPPVATWTLIIANALVFLFQISLSRPEQQAFLAHFALIPAYYFVDPSPKALGDYLPFVSNMFLHGGWMHIILNMWSLWIFGPAVEDRLGSARYTGFYFTAGIIASVTHAVFNPGSAAPALGASGAIAGVIGCYARMFPWARIIVVVPILFIPLFFPVPALLFAGLWFLAQLLQGWADLFGPGAMGG